MRLPLHPGERLLSTRGESVAASAPRLSFLAALAMAGLAIQRWGPSAECGGLLQWVAVAGCAWSEAQRWGARLWITDRRVVSRVGLSHAPSEIPLALLGPFTIEPARMGSAWLVATDPLRPLAAHLLLIGRAPEALAIAEKARLAAWARSAQRPSLEPGDDLR